MVEVPLDEVVDVIPVWNPLVSACRAVHVSLRVLAAVMVRRAPRGMLGADLKHVVVHVIAMHVM